MFNNILIKNSQLVEAQFRGSVATGRKYYFTDIPNLSRNNIVLYGFSALTATQLSTAPSGKTVIAAADADQIVVTLRDIHKKEFVYQHPLYNLIRSNVGGFVSLLVPRRINLTDCYVEVTDTTGISTDEVVLFNFFYDIL
jgi:hypothetical protein